MDQQHMYLTELTDLTGLEGLTDLADLTDLTHLTDLTSWLASWLAGWRPAPPLPEHNHERNQPRQRLRRSRSEVREP